MLNIIPQPVADSKNVVVIVEDKEINEAASFGLAENPTQADALALAKMVGDAVAQFYLPVKREMATDEIREFIANTDEWIEAMEKIAINKKNVVGGSCPGCGIKPAKIKALQTVLKLLV